jgi:hypothetical protein
VALTVVALMRDALTVDATTAVVLTVVADTVEATTTLAPTRVALTVVAETVEATTSAELTVEATTAIALTVVATTVEALTVVASTSDALTVTKETEAGSGLSPYRTVGILSGPHLNSVMSRPATNAPTMKAPRMYGFQRFITGGTVGVSGVVGSVPT